MGLTAVDTEVSVILPCLNEEKTLRTCINKIKQGLLKEGITGEIIVVDNGSTDHSKRNAEEEKVLLLNEPKRGYGAAYLCGLGKAKGNYILIGDSDNTYDFGDIKRFIQPLREGFDFVIGSRMKGKIHKNAMPWLHRYLGNPLLSGMCRLFFHTKISDVHCGMRSLTHQAYKKMGLKTTGMEFATEMVISAIQQGLKIYEIPIDYYPRKGESKLKPLYDAWRHIRFMLLYCPLWLYFIPGFFGFFGGFLILLALYNGPLLFMGHQWNIHANILASIICILSYQILNLGVFAHIYAIRQGFLHYDRLTKFFQRHFSLEKGILFGGSCFIIGAIIFISIGIEWFSKKFGSLHRINDAILSLTLLVIGLQTIFFSFFISLLYLERKNS